MPPTGWRKRAVPDGAEAKGKPAAKAKTGGMTFPFLASDLIPGDGQPVPPKADASPDSDSAPLVAAKAPKASRPKSQPPKAKTLWTDDSGLMPPPPKPSKASRPKSLPKHGGKGRGKAKCNVERMASVQEWLVTQAPSPPSAKSVLIRPRNLTLEFADMDASADADPTNSLAARLGLLRDTADDAQHDTVRDGDSQEASEAREVPGEACFYVCTCVVFTHI